MDSPVTVILAESSLELVPPEIWGHPAVYRNARRRGKKPGETLLDVSLHYDAMRRLREREKRGRPDIVHFTLLELLSSPLNRSGRLRVYVHTIGGKVLYFDPSVRIPKNYNRFVGLMEQVLALGRAPPTGKPLIRVEDKSFTRLLGEVGGGRVIGLSRRGRPISLGRLADMILGERGVVVVGGFPHGFFSKEVREGLQDLYSIYPEGLEAWIVVSRLLCMLEGRLGILLPA